MIKHFFQGLARTLFATRPPARLVLTQAQHGIRKNTCSDALLRTVNTLHKAGFEAYLVGGAVRDLMLGHQPKDFDVATSAKPEEVRALFRRNSHIIGRRFRLVHVLYGGDLIEVSTFRGNHKQMSQDAVTSHSGRIVRDNVFGSIHEDAMRRDFTINALYYDPSQEEVLDFHGGLADIRAGVLRLIGDAETRYIEDPVRILRAVRLSAKLNFNICPSTLAPIAKNHHLLHDVPTSRLFDELVKFFLFGYAVNSMHALHKHKLVEHFFPLLAKRMPEPLVEHFVTLALTKTDARVLAEKSVNPSFLFASLLWPSLTRALQQQSATLHPMPALCAAMSEVLIAQAQTLAIPARYTATMRDIWSLQPRFLHRAGRRPWGVLAHPRYRAGYDFLLLRCEAGECSQELGDWWTIFADADAEARQRMLVVDTQVKRRRRTPKSKELVA